jgi:cysteinyl-tRNA synthetase
MNEDAAALGVQRPDHEPRATEYVPQMLDMIGTLEQNGYAYVAEQWRRLLFSVRKFEGYGKLSGKSLEDLRAGERVDVMSKASRIRSTSCCGSMRVTGTSPPK